MNQQKRILYKMIHIQVLIIDIQYPTLSGMSVRAHTGLLQTVYCIYNLMFIYTDRHRQVNRDTIVIITITGLMQVVLTMRVMAILFSVYLFDSTTIFSTETKILFLIFVLMI